MENKKQEIIFHAKHMRELIEQIKNCYKVIKSIDDESLQKDYAREIYPLIEEYDQLKLDLKQCLLDYFEMEVENNVPQDLLLRRLYQSLH